MLSYIDHIENQDKHTNQHLLDENSGFFAVLGAFYNASIQEINQRYFHVIDQLTAHEHDLQELEE